MDYVRFQRLPLAGALRPDRWRVVSGCAKSGRFKTSPASRRPTDCSLTPTAMMSDSFRSMQLGAILLMGVRR